MLRSKFSKVLLMALLMPLSATAFSQELTPSINTVSPLAQNLSNMGSLSCVDRANQMSNFLSTNRQAELIIQTPKDNVNNRLLMAGMVIRGGNLPNAYSSLSLAPNQVNGCGGSYRTIFYSSNSCSKASAANFPGKKFQAVGKSNSQIALINRAQWVVAMPADKGCIFIKEEIIE